MKTEKLKILDEKIAKTKKVEFTFALLVAILLSSFYYWYRVPVPLVHPPLMDQLMRSGGELRIDSGFKTNTLRIGEESYVCYYRPATAAWGSCLLELKGSQGANVDVYWYEHPTKGPKSARLAMQIIRKQDGKFLLSYENQKMRLLDNVQATGSFSRSMLLLEAALVFSLAFVVLWKLPRRY